MSMEQSPTYAMLQSIADQTPVITTADQYRIEAYEAVGDDSRSEHGQFVTPPQVASIIAALFGDLPSEIRLLDAGAGIGSLIAAFIDEIITRKKPSSSFFCGWSSNRYMK